MYIHTHTHLYNMWSRVQIAPEVAGAPEGISRSREMNQTAKYMF